jgi:DNA-binding winged helix-turn-helix (wHTH) protein
MDSLITAAAHALAAGDPLGALNRVALRDDAPALALRGIAMAQLGDLVRAKALLRRAERAFHPREVVARARCVVAEAEIAFVSRDLGRPTTALENARVVLEAHGDRINAAHARLIDVRRLVLIGRLGEAERQLAAIHQLVVAGIAIRRLRTQPARIALARAAQAARRAGIPGLTAEVERASLILTTAAARLLANGKERLLLLEEVEVLPGSHAFVVDACRHAIQEGGAVISLSTRPVLFAIVRTLAEAWPGDVARDTLVARAFGSKFVDESHRVRLRVEVGRLRRVLGALAGVSATKRGFALVPRRGREVVVLAWPSDIDDAHAAVLSCLSDGESWSSSSLALTLGASQRTVQRALDSLAAAGKAQSFGRGRARRWTTPPVPGFTTTLLLPALLPG